MRPVPYLTWLPRSLVSYERTEPPSGADPDRPPYEGGAAAVRGGLASGAGLEPAMAGVRALQGTPTPTRNWYGRRDSNSHAAGSEPARYASSRHARGVRRQGLEPRFPGLRVQCCTRIARGARSGMQVDLKGLEPLCRLRAKQMLIQLSYRPAVNVPGRAEPMTDLPIGPVLSTR